MWVPSCLVTIASNSSSWRASAPRIGSGASSQSAVLPSTSVRRKVTVPVGSFAIPRPRAVRQPSRRALYRTRGQERQPAAVRRLAGPALLDREAGLGDHCLGLVRPVAREEPIDLDAVRG